MFVISSPESIELEVFLFVSFLLLTVITLLDDFLLLNFPFEFDLTLFFDFNELNFKSFLLSPA